MAIEQRLGLVVKIKYRDFGEIKTKWRLKGKGTVCYAIGSENIELVRLLKIMMGGEEWENKHMQKSLYVFSVIILVVMVLVLLFWGCYICNVT